jgi:hypothetical protein
VDIVITQPQKEVKSKMSRSNKTLVPEAKQALDSLKMEIASQLGVNLKEGYNGDLTSRENGSIGGEMVRRMIAYAENQIK